MRWRYWRGSYSNTELIVAGNLAGMAIELCSTTILHALSYPLTGFYNIPHGEALGFLLPTICDYMDFDLNKYINPKVKLNNINFDLIIKQGLQYNKINHVNKKIDFDKIKTMMEKIL